MPKKNQEVTIEHYREMLSSTCNEAITTMQTYLDNNPNANRQKLLEKAYDIATVYGRASGTLAANKYDQDALLAEKRGQIKPGQIKEAEIAYLPDFGEIARAINGTIKHSSLAKVPETVGRLVKQQAEDTTLKNANRDGAEYAWIPAGDTCVFCLSLAANGWQRATKSTAEGNHADHIHPHCDCTFVTRFSKDTQIAGYHPEKIKAFIESQEGDTWAEKLNSLRREQYAEKKSDNHKILGRHYAVSGFLTEGAYKEALLLWAQEKEISGLTAKEKEHVTEEFDEWLPRFLEDPIVRKDIGNYRYTAICKGHNQYKIIDKKRVGGYDDIIDEVLSEVIGDDWRKYEQ